MNQDTLISPSNAVLAAATKEAAFLTDREREIILGVLTKDEQLRRQQQTRVLQLKAELQHLRRKGALKVTDWNIAGPEPDRTCGRCRIELGRVINRGAFCRSCRLKVCKSCREYNFKATDWVCNVCFKRMEIQAASGEWMNEFVRRPSKKRDARVYVPAADIIKRTIRRSWTISNPTSRWPSARSSPEHRPYNSLPRGHDISNYPSLASHQTITSSHSPTRRAKSEDVYAERNATTFSDSQSGSRESSPKRINPLISMRRQKNESQTDETLQTPKVDDNMQKSPERHVSFESQKAADLAYFRSRSLSHSKEGRRMPFSTRSLPEEVVVKEEGEAAGPVELCDIEPISGTVFRKMTVRRRRQQNMRKMAALDSGWRRPEADLLDILLPDGEDYRLVFVNSDSSSKEEDLDDNDSSSASSFPIDECDWDYFEPGASRPLSWGSPFGSPSLYRKGGLMESPLGSPLVQRRRPRLRHSSDEELAPAATSHPSTTPDAMHCIHSGSTIASTSCCTNCGGHSAAQFIPVPVPIPIPFPVPLGAAKTDDFWHYVSQLPGFPWSYLERPMADKKAQSGEVKEGEEEELMGHLESENRAPSASESDSSSSSDSEHQQRRVYNVSGNTNHRESDDALPSSAPTSDNDEVDHKSSADEEESSSGSADTDSDDTGTVADQKTKRFSRVFVVNKKVSSDSETHSGTSSDSSSDNDTDTELDCSVVLTHVKSFDSEQDLEVGDSNTDQGVSLLSIKPLGEEQRRRYKGRKKNLSSSNADQKRCDNVDRGGQGGSNINLKALNGIDMESNAFNSEEVIGDLVDGSVTQNQTEASTHVNNNKKDEKLQILANQDNEEGDNRTETSREEENNATGNTTEHSSDENELSDNKNSTGCLEKTNSLSLKLSDLDSSETNQYIVCATIEEIHEPTEDIETSNGSASDVSTQHKKECVEIRQRDETFPEEHFDPVVTPEHTVSSEFLLPTEEDNDSTSTVSAKEELISEPTDHLHLDAQNLVSNDATLNDSTSTEDTKSEKLKSISDYFDAISRQYSNYSPSPNLSDLSCELSSSDEKDSTFAEDARVASTGVEESRASFCSVEKPSVDRELTCGDGRNVAKYTSLVMITNDDEVAYRAVNVVTSDTTRVVDQGVVVRHTNLEEDEGGKDDSLQNTTTADVTIITSSETLSAFEEGLADDDSWVEDLSHDDEEDDFPTTSSGEEVTLTCSAVVDQEDELRGYHRTAIDFTLHTIVEESCEESEVELPTTNLEKYFFYGLGNGAPQEDQMSETSSIYSEGMESLGGVEDSGDNSEDLASSRLEKYFLSGFMGFKRDSDGSVGSDSEGKPSPEQRRKRLVRARGTGRSHSQDNLDQIEQEQQQNSESDDDDFDETLLLNEGQFDTVKRKKAKKHANLDTTQDDEDDDRNKTPQPEDLSNLQTTKNQQSRDSGFVGSNDDLLRDQKHQDKSPELDKKILEEDSRRTSLPPATNLTRKDSFNNWSSDEETNLMMSKMRQFFKSMVNKTSPKPFPRAKMRCKPPQLVYFENELTRLMKTVPGIRDDQVREIVEYLSSEDTWSDSYDSSDYTSSDLEGACTKSALQQQISDSCKEIINKFEGGDEEGDAGDGGIVETKETAFVYQKLMASFEKMATDEQVTTPTSPPLIAKVMHHIGSRLVALMHEVSSGESLASNSPKRNYHRKLQQKLSNASSTTDDDLDDIILLPRSKSHDLLMAEKSQQNMEINEEREASDCERFSWRGSFESALLAADSRQKLSLIGENSAKRRSAGDLLFKSLSKEQLDRVRSCGSIGGATSEEKLWTKSNQRRSSVPDSSDSDEDLNRSTLPRTLQMGPQSTNSLPRLPTTSVPKQVKSARYRPPGVARLVAPQPKRALSAPGLQPTPRRGRRSQFSSVPSDDVPLSEAHSSPMLAMSRNKSATPSPVAHGSRRTTVSMSSQEWPGHDDDIDRLVTMHQRSSLSSLGLRSDSMASVYSGAGDGRYGAVTVRGQIEFGLQYNYKAGALEIHIKQCRDLAPVDLKRNRSDPYVKVYLLPDKSKSGKRKTKVKKHTLNPVFDENLKFHMTLNELEIRTLWLSVWHSDMFGRNDFLGEVTMTLENKVFDDPTPKFYNLQERTEPFEDVLSFKGDIIVGLRFVPPDMTVNKKGKRSRGSLHILVKEAKALTAVKAHGFSDPFCKSYLLPDKGRSAKQKTPVIKKTINPVWNHTFIYDDVTLQELAERSLELTVWDHDRLASNEFLGMVRFSLGTGKHYGKPADWMDSTGKELNLWKSMLERPNFWVEGCLPLRSSSSAKMAQ